MGTVQEPVSADTVQRCLSRPVVNVAHVRPAECFSDTIYISMLTINVRAVTGEIICIRIDTSLTNQTLKSQSRTIVSAAGNDDI